MSVVSSAFASRVIGARPLHDAVPDKTSIVFSLPNEPGSLFKALSVFALRGVDLTKLESRPIPGRKWEYLFYADLAAARDDLPCVRALAHMAEFAPLLHSPAELGSQGQKPSVGDRRSRLLTGRRARGETSAAGSAGKFGNRRDRA